MKSKGISAGYVRLGVVIGVFAVAIDTLLAVVGESRMSAAEFFIGAAVFFVIYFLSTLGVGWAFANFRSSDRIYSAGAVGVAVLAPLAAASYVLYFISRVSESESGFTLEKILRLMIALAAPVFLVVAVVLGLTFSIHWVKEGFVKS